MFQYADRFSRRLPIGRSVHNIANRSGDRYGSCRSSTAFSTLNMIVFRPIASASVAMEAVVKLGVFPSVRTA